MPPTTSDAPPTTDSPITPDAPDPEFVTLNAAPCALDVEGALHCWGNEDLGFPAYDRGPYIDLAAFDGRLMLKLLRPDGSPRSFNCTSTAWWSGCMEPRVPLMELPFFGGGRAFDGTIHHADHPATGQSLVFDPTVDWRLLATEGEVAALSTDGGLRRMLWGTYPDDPTGEEPPRVYQVPDHEDVVEVAAYDLYSMCVRYADGDILCFVDGNDEQVEFPNPPYSHLSGSYIGICAVQAETWTIECSGVVPDRNLGGPVKALSIGTDSFGIPVCVLTTDNAIRCDGTYNHELVADQLPKGTGVPTPP